MPFKLCEQWVKIYRLVRCCFVWVKICSFFTLPCFWQAQDDSLWAQTPLCLYQQGEARPDGRKSYLKQNAFWLLPRHL